jgi:hypothetical protein
VGVEYCFTEFIKLDHFKKTDLFKFLEADMTSNKTHEDQTSAADKSIGFEYQYYYFLYRVLKMCRRESVGLEVKDDVHTDLSCNRQILIQLKHTIQKKADGTPKNLTTYDSDLWKTLSNWSKVIADKNAGRVTENSHLDFISKTDFMLVTNKSETKSCRFFDVLENPANARTELQSLKVGTIDEDIQDYIQDVLSLSDFALIAFLHHIHMELEIDDVIGRCKDAIIEKQIHEKRVDQVFRDLDSQIRQDNYMTIRNLDKIIISFEEFNLKYRRFFDKARSADLIIDRYHDPLPTKLTDQKFILQLLDIGEIQPDSIEEMAQFTSYMLTVKKNLLNWEINGDLTGAEVKEFNNEAKLRWQNKFHATNRNPDKKAPNVLAFEVLDEMRKEKLCIDTQQMGTEFSNGEYYLLSDIPEIGWHQNWEEKHK